MPALLDTRGLLDYLKIGRTTLHHLLQDGLPRYRLGSLRALRFRRDEIDAWLESRREGDRVAPEPGPGYDDDVEHLRELHAEIADEIRDQIKRRNDPEAVAEDERDNDRSRQYWEARRAAEARGDFSERDRIRKVIDDGFMEGGSE